MTLRKISALVLFTIFAATGCSQSTAARQVLDKVKAAYKALETYQAQGTITLNADSGGRKVNAVTTFSILLKKPNQYLISWTQQMPMGMNSSGAVWNDGTQPYLYLYMDNAYSKMTNDEMALGNASGFSGGAAITVPSLFLPVFQAHTNPFVRLQHLKMEPAEKLGNEECYVISATSSAFEREVYWISKSRYLILQHSLEGRVKIPEMTDKQLDAAISRMGANVTAETRKARRDMLVQSRKRTAALHLSGEFTEMHTGITSPALDKKDFVFTPPAGAVLKESLLGGLMK